MITTCIELIVFYLAHGIVLMVLEASLPIKKEGASLISTCWK
jgi:hypothetical protein